MEYSFFYMWRNTLTYVGRKIDGIWKSFFHQKSLPQIQEDTGIYHPMKSISSGHTQSIYFEIGVGIYQGEVKDIRRWAFSDHPQWMVSKLTVDSLSRIPDEYPKLLRYLACLLEQYHKQPERFSGDKMTKRGEQH
jgi:hypothetical protein